MRRVAAMVGLGQAEGGAAPALEAAEDEFLLLFVTGAELFEHRNEGEVADDAVLVLQIVMEPQPLRREMFADLRHPQVRPVLAAICFGRPETPVTRLEIGSTSHREHVGKYRSLSVVAAYFNKKIHDKKS